MSTMSTTVPIFNSPTGQGIGRRRRGKLVRKGEGNAEKKRYEKEEIGKRPPLESVIPAKARNPSCICFLCLPLYTSDFTHHTFFCTYPWDTGSTGLLGNWGYCPFCFQTRPDTTTPKRKPLLLTKTSIRKIADNMIQRANRVNHIIV